MKKKVFAYLHTHWDREWYREFEEFRIRLVEVTDDILEKLQSNQVETFYFDGQIAALEDYLEIKPEKKEIIKNFINDRRLFIGPYYCSTDSFLVDTESLIKNLQIGLLESEKFGCTDFIAYHADTFGHSAHMPNIIKYFNIPNAIFWRGLGELESEFLFNGLKSTYLIEGYFHDYFSLNVSDEKKAAMLKRTLDRIAKYSSNNILLPLGADHLAVAPNIKHQIEKINKYLDDYEIILSTPFEYLKQVHNNYKKDVKHEFRSTERNFILPGVLSSRTDIKQYNAKSQWLLARLVQPLQAICAYLNKSKNFQKETDYLYKELIKNHAHDSIYGCSTDKVHKENKMRFLKVTEGANAILNSIRRDLYNDKHLTAINLANFEFKGALKIKTPEKLSSKYNAQLIGKTKGFPLKKLYDINQIPVTEDYTNIYEYLIDVKKIAPLSIQNLTENDLQKESSLKISDKSIENNKILLQVSDNQIVLTDKINKQKYKNFITFTDRADIGDSYNFGALKNDKPIIAQIIKSKIKEQGHIRCILEIDFEIRIPKDSKPKKRSKSTHKHILKVFATLENQNDYIDFNINWKNKSINHILQATFNFDKPINNVYNDDLTGFTKREFNPEYDIYKHIPAQRGIELKHNTAPIQKSLWTRGVGIITEGLQEYEIKDNKINLTLLRATGIISNPHNPTRGTPAGPPLLTPDLQMQGQNTARFAVSFIPKYNNIYPNIEKFYGASLLFKADLPSQKLFEVNNKNFLISSIKTNINNDLVLRFLNTSDKAEIFEIKVLLPNEKIFIADALERIKKEYNNAQKIEANSFITLIIKNRNDRI